LVSWAGASAAFVLATVLSLAAVALLRGVHEPARATTSRRRVADELRHGAALVWRHPLLRPVLLCAVVWNTAWFVLQAAYVPYAMRTLGLDASQVGITLACYGVGMVLGAFGAVRVMRVLPFGGAILLGPFVSVAAALTMAATVWQPSGLLAGASFFLFGAGPVVWVVSSTTLRQTVTPHAVLGQVSAIMLTVNAGARPIGAALGGLIGARYGESACLVVAAIGFVLQAAVITASPMRSLRTLPAAAAG
jgi:predicted MFS family arabinose efflux permease